jgi:hypothetical protein
VSRSPTGSPPRPSRLLSAPTAPIVPAGCPPAPPDAAALVIHHRQTRSFEKLCFDTGPAVQPGSYAADPTDADPWGGSALVGGRPRRRHPTEARRPRRCRLSRYGDDGHGRSPVTVWF